jgi:glutathione S-transferase
MKLYYAPAACSLAPNIAAREAGLDLALEKVDLGAKKTESGRDYLSISPKGAVPALELDTGDVLTENAIVLQYLADKAPQSGLMVANGMARWHFLELVNFIATELHKGFGPLWHPISAEGREAAIENLSKRFDILDRQLGDQPYFTGETFTIADAYAYAVLNWTKIHKIDMRRWPRLMAFLDRLRSGQPCGERLLRRDSRKHDQARVTNLEISFFPDALRQPTAVPFAPL